MVKNQLTLLMIAAFIMSMSEAVSQGLPGAVKEPSPRGGTSAGGLFIPGKTDDARWRFLESHQRELLGKTKPEITKLFGKVGGPGLENDQLVYQVTASL